MGKRLTYTVLKAGFLGVIFSMVSCTHTPTSEPFRNRIYASNYDKVWDMAVKALADYPIKVSNKDTGKIQTEVINSPYNELFFTFPERVDLPERFRYSLKLSIANINENSDEEGLTRIRITKELERFHDFYTGWVAYPSDGIEEKLFLYRVQHLIEMDRHLSENKPAEEN